MNRRKLWKQLVAIAVLVTLVGTGSFVVGNWQPDQPVEALIGKWAQPPSTFVELQGMNVHLRDEGPRDDPLPIVLLHGTGASLHTWDGWVEVLSQERRVIRFDLPGFGLTGPNADGDYGVNRYTEFVAAMLDSIGVEKTVLGGNSLGGNIAWATAVRYPERVDKLVLLNATGYDFKPESVPIGFTLARIPVVRNMIRNVMPRDAVRSSIESVYGDPSRVTPELVDLYFDISTREGNRTALMQRLEQLEGGGMAHLIKEVSQPTLILWGRKDRLVPVINAERFDADIDGSELVVWDDLGHVPHEEDPARTVQAVQAFLEAD
ncbi:MAG: alpha/beta hydrolase [Woeseiaceae bacterium]|nr:alpha/beta hydrolase [Woeseiaceae bacterium]